MKKIVCLLLAYMVLLSAGCFSSFAEQTAVYPKPPSRPAFLPENADKISRSASDPTICCQKKEVAINETFSLTWNEPNVNWAVLFIMVDYGEFQSLGFVDTVSTGYQQSFQEIGVYTYCLMTLVDGDEWKQSNFIDVMVTADEDTTCSQLEKRGMTNVWNLLFLVYRNVKVGDFEKSFTDEQISAVRSYASKMKYAMEDLSDGRMKVGTVDLIVIDEPVTSVTSVGYELPALSYGPGKDVDFFYILDHKDVNLVAVVVPLLGMNNASDWYGLGGTYETINDKRLYTIIINAVYTGSETWNNEGKSYPLSMAVYVHETLHAVETNSRTNGWNDFQPLHNLEENGYEFVDENYQWYQDLMRNTLKNGKYGFLKQSYYLYHHNIPSNMRSGVHKDYDNISRLYIDGIPVNIDIIIPASVAMIEVEAFAGIQGKRVFIPATVQSIGNNAFDAGTIIYGYKDSPAETWAADNGYRFIQVY